MCAYKQIAPAYSKAAFPEFGPVRGKQLTHVFVLLSTILGRDLPK